MKDKIIQKAFGMQIMKANAELVGLAQIVKHDPACEELSPEGKKKFLDEIERIQKEIKKLPEFLRGVV
jgi:hypothetical protein